MATKQQIRKVAAVSTVDFDEQQWPINVALVILGAFVAGVVLATSDFDDPRVFYNGWVRMLGVLLTMGLLFGGVAYLQQKVIRRVQLCVLLSLLFHLWLALYLHQHYLRLLAQEELRRARHEEVVYQQITVPDYHWEQTDQPETRQSFEEPVETQDLVDAEPEPLEPQTAERPMPTQEKPDVEPAEQQRQQPSPADLRRAELSAPRRAEAAAGGQVSRQEWKQRPLPDEPIPEPEIRPPGERPDQPLVDQVAAVQRREMRAPRQERHTFDEPSAERQFDAAQLARSARESEPAPRQPTTPAPTRQLTQPAEVAQTEAAAPQPVPAVAQPQSVELAPATELAAGRQSDPSRPIAGKQTAEPALAAAAEPGQATPEHRRLDLAPEVARSPQPRPTRHVQRAEVAAEPVAQEPSRAVAQAASPSESSLSPAEAAVSRRMARAAPTSLAELSAIASESQPGRAGETAPAPAQIARVSRHESAPERLAGGGAPAPARASLGRQLTADIQAEPMPVSTAAAEAAGKQGLPLEASVQGARQQVAGLPASRRNVPMTSAAAPQIDHGEAAPVAVARRASALNASEGAPGVRLDVAATLTRAPSGIDLPSAVAPSDQAPRPGAGMTAADSAAPATLEAGQVATVQRTSAVEVPAGDPSMAAPSADFAVNAAEIVALAGQLASGLESSPVPSIAGQPEPLGRTTALASLSITEVDAAVDTASAGPAGAAAAQSGELAYSAAPANVARAAAAGLPAGSPTTAGMPATDGAQPEVDATQLARRGSGEVVLASAEVAAVGSPQRMVGRLPIAEAIAEMPAGTPIAASTGEPNPPAGAALQAAEVGSQRRTPGLPGLPSDRAPGAELATEPGPTSTTPGTTPGPRRLPDGQDDAPALAALVGGAPLRKSTTPGLPRGLAEKIEPELAAAVGGAEAGLAIELTEGALAGEPSRRESGLPVQIAALPGPGGLSFNPSPEVGVPSRRASRESEVVHDVSSRFVVERSGGELAIDGTVNEPTEGFRHRTEGRRAEIAQARGGTEGTERAVEMGLDYLARIQFPDGHWSLHELPPGVTLPDPALGTMQADTAATGLALLAYLGAGYTHLDDKHRTIVDKGLAWMVRNQKPNGDLFTGGSRPAWFYSHGIAAIALCEAYGMTQDPQLREPAQLAIRFICETQHPTRGGWRYELDSQGRSRETDTSVSGWQLLALKSAQMAGLEVPSEVLAKVDGWLDLAQAPQSEGQYVYNPYAADLPEQRAGRNPNLAMTAEAMLMRIYLGRNRDNDRLIAGADFLRRNPPEVGTGRQPLRDCYYWYYATQAMFQMQEPYWTQWNDRLRPLMESGQEQTGPLAGSWHPLRPVPDRWGHAGGRLYVTTLHLLMLEVYYRHLPLFQELSR
ncbi:MAG: hypothetical protein RBS80_01435 [Thermoguttaceae bacterium]|jgi:hypothetical protein|nr:hypothetical protein [Thermoguttaceae bacterium]